MGSKCVLTIDAGTTSVKVSIFSKKLCLLHCSVQEYALDAENGFVQAKAEVYINAIRTGISAVLNSARECEIAAISVTTQGETLALFDKSGTPLTPFIVWLDARGGKQAEALLNKIDTQSFYEETGLPEIQGALPIAKAMWLCENEPQLFEKADKILLLEDYLLYLFTGNILSEKSVQTSTGWFSLKADDYWQDALSFANIPPEKLPRLCESGAPAGKLTSEAAKLFNLPQGITVVAGAMDQTAAALGAGCVNSGLVTETTGTALVMAACTESPVFSKQHRLTIYRHAIKGLYLYLPIGNTAGMALKWFRDEFCDASAKSGYSEMDMLALQATAGCSGLVFLPFLAGSVDPDACADAKGVFYGATLATKKADFARSILEAVGFMLKDFIEMLGALGVTPREILSLGGGSRSALWQQIKADICNMPFYSANCSEAASRGAALLALWGAGLLPQNEVPPMQDNTRYSPRAEAAQSYKAAYGLYKRLYTALKPIYTGGTNE